MATTSGHVSSCLKVISKELVAVIKAYFPAWDPTPRWQMRNTDSTEAGGRKLIATGAHVEKRAFACWDQERFTGDGGADRCGQRRSYGQGLSLAQGAPAGSSVITLDDHAEHSLSFSPHVIDRAATTTTRDRDGGFQMRRSRVRGGSVHCRSSSTDSTRTKNPPVLDANPALDPVEFRLNK